jgi:O-antigen/teichoic acid export membrane protein
MNKRESLVLLKNAAANVVRGGAAAIVAIILPPFLTRLMNPESYGTWALVLQLSAYIGYFDFGIQTAIGRFVAHANERGDTEYRNRIVSTACVALGIAGLLGISGSVAAASFLPNLFPQMPFALVGNARVALLLMAGSLAIGLPASAFNGIFIGLQRYEVPAAIIGGTRLLGAILVVLVARRGGDLVAMAVAIAAVNLVSYGLQYWTYRKLARGVRISAKLASRKMVRELFDYCLSLSIWSFAMLLVSGLDVMLVGYFQFEAVAYYAVAASLIAFLAGLQNTLFNVMIPSAAVLHARGDSHELGRVVITATRYGTFLLLLMGIPLILGARNIMTLWVGPTYAIHGARILQVLVAANIIRLSAVPYVMTLIGAGEQRLVTLTPLLEGVSNFAASIVAGYMFGAIGVAIGTLFGSIVGVSGNLLYNMRRTAGIAIRISDYVRDGLLRPAVCACPLFVYVTGMQLNHWSDTRINYCGFVASLLATAFLIWRWGLVGAERERLRAWRLALQS